MFFYPPTYHVRQFLTYNIRFWGVILNPPKGQLIYKCLFDVFTLFQKTKENKSTSSKEEFVCSFLEETLAWKNHFDFFWPLLTLKSDVINRPLDFDLIAALAFRIYLYHIVSELKLFSMITVEKASTKPFVTVCQIIHHMKTKYSCK